MKKRHTIIAWLLLLPLLGGAQSPVVDQNLFKRQGAEVAGAGNSLLYWTGRDTIGPAAGISITGHDTAITTGWIQIQWKPDDAGTYPRKTLSDSLAVIGANLLWVWISPDTTTLSSGDSAGYGKYGDGDSAGVARAEFRVALLESDTASGYPAWLPDTTNIFLQSGNYASPFYGQWVFEPRIGAISVVGTIKRWRIYPIRVPAATWFQVRFRASDSMKEATVINWRIVGIRG